MGPFDRAFEGRFGDSFDRPFAESFDGPVNGALHGSFVVSFSITSFDWLHTHAPYNAFHIFCNGFNMHIINTFFQTHRSPPLCAPPYAGRFSYF